MKIHVVGVGGKARGILRYVAGLTEPLHQDGVELPGWWVAHDPDEILPTPGGHANFGMAHGAAVILGSRNDLWHVRQVWR